MKLRSIIFLLAENIRITKRIEDKLAPNIFKGEKYTKQQLSILLRLYMSKKIKLKEFSSSEFISTANLCSVFKKLEQDGLVIRNTDKDDRRDVWYEVSKRGKFLSQKILTKCLKSLETIYHDISNTDELEINKALKTVNTFLKKAEKVHVKKNIINSN